MIPSSWYRMVEIKGRDEQLRRRRTARHRDVGAAAPPSSGCAATLSSLVGGFGRR